MPVPSNITDLDPVANNNSPPGTESAKGNIDNYLRSAFSFIRQIYNGSVAPASTTIASAATTNIGAATTSNIIIGGTTTITAFDTVADGIIRYVTYSGAVPITHNATSMILLGGASRTNSAGDSSIFKSLGSGNWREIDYSPASGYAKAGANTDITSLGGLTTPLSIAQGGTGAASINLQKSYDSGDLTYTLGAAVALTHSLGAVPKLVEVFLHCVNSDVGYSPGALVRISGTSEYDGSLNRGMSLVFSSTTISVIVGLSASIVVNPSTFAVGGVTPANWKIVVRAYA